MDKTTIALAATEDNAAAIRELTKRIARKTSLRIVESHINDENKTSFGNVTSDGTTGVLVRFAGAATALVFCGNVVINTGSPILTLLPAGSGELMMISNKPAAALIIGEP